MKVGRAFFCLFFLLSSVALAQNRPGTTLSIKKATGEITLDGALKEADWATAEAASGFFLNFPVDSLPPLHETTAKLTFDNQYLYVAIHCEDDAKANVVQSLRRDVDFFLNDNVGIYLNPFNDYTNGFYFMITPFGVQSEGTVANGGVSDGDFNLSWDNKWYSSVLKTDSGWTAELAIPFKTLRYNLGEWNITFVRNDAKRNEISSWIATPIQYYPGSFAYAGKLIWEDPAPKPGANISVIPYLSGTTSSSAENDVSAIYDGNAGFDAKVALTPSLNLDLTFNPDFSQVEVDRQVINLTRFEFGFPERRQFFLENNDLFSQPGFPESRPFFSRRIGLASDSLGRIQQVPIVYGARVSGKLGENWRIGAMNMHTAEQKELGLPDQNYTVAVAQRQIFSRSNIGLVFVNKQSLGLGAFDENRYYHPGVVRERIQDGDTALALNRYNRVFGFDFNLITKDNRWQGDIYYHRSFDAFADDDNYSFGAFIGYFTRPFNAFFGQTGLGQNFNAEAGFVPSRGVYPGLYSGFLNLERNYYPNRNNIVLMGPRAGIDYVMTPSGILTDRALSFNYEWVMSTTASLEVGYRYVFQKLPSDFNPLEPRGDSTLLSGQAYTWHEFGANFNSDTRKLFNYAVEVSYGGFYSGRLFSAGASVNYRYQPYGSLSIRADYSALDFPVAYGRAQFLLVGPRMDLTFSRKLFLTTFVQYNDRFDNVNLNARLQWRFKPASDFFLVYTENYFTGSLNSKNRALVAKLTYWLNL